MTDQCKNCVALTDNEACCQGVRAEVDRLTAECQKWQEWHDCEYRERKKYRQDANYFSGEVDRMTAELAEKEHECKGLMNSNTELCYIMDAMITALDGKPVSDFAESFPFVRRLQDALAVKDAEIERLRKDNHAHCTALMTTAMWEGMEEKLQAAESLAASRLADQEAIERHTEKRVAGEICEYLCKEWPFMGAGAVMDIKERYGVK